MAKGQRTRKQKISSGNGIKHRGVVLNEQQKILLGGGMLVNVNKRWKRGNN